MHNMIARNMRVEVNFQEVFFSLFVVDPRLAFGEDVTEQFLCLVSTV